MATIEKRGLFQYRAKVRKKGFPGKSKTYNSRKEAEVWARKTESEMERNLYVDSTEAEQTILYDALERYLREITPAKKGAAQEKTRIKKWQQHFLAKQSLATIRGADLAKYRDVRMEEGKSSNTVRLELAVLSHLFTIARKEWGMESLANPVQNIRMPNNSRPRERRLLPNEEERLLEACRKSKSKGLEPIVIVALETAMRQGELLGLEWENVDLKRRIAHLPDTKNSLPRNVPLSSRALEVLKARPRDIKSARVFYEWKRNDSVGNVWRRALARAGIEGLRFHDLRHEATSRLFEKGLNIMEVAAITGHKDLRMLKRYTHLRAEDLAAKLG